MAHSLSLFILGWYFFSITLSLYNKWMFDPSKGMQISYPISITAIHQFTLWTFSYAFIRYRRVKSIGDSAAVEPSHDWNFYFKYIVPTAVATAGDIGFGNVSFKFVPLTVYTIIKSASIAFVLLFGVLFKLEVFHWKLAAIVAVMFFGVVLMVISPSKGHKNGQSEQNALVFGSFLVIMSSCLSGLRWVITQYILKATEEKNHVAIKIQDEEQNGVQESEQKSPKVRQHPIYTIHQLAPIMGVILFFTGLALERPYPALLQSQLFTVSDDPTKRTAASVLRGIVLLVIPGMEVFFMTICEFRILQIAQVLTLSIAGIVKELLTIVVSMIILHERISGLHNWIGMSLILLDVAYYNYYRYEENQAALKAAESYAAMSNSENPISGPINDIDNKDNSEQTLVPTQSSQDYELDTLPAKLPHHYNKI